MRKVESFKILGVKINVLTVNSLADEVKSWIENKYCNYIVLTGVHGIIEMQNNKELLNINNNAGLVTPDGMPTVWYGKLLGFKNIEKVYAPDIMFKIFKQSVENNYKHYLYGGKDGVAKKLAAILSEKYPGIEIVGTYCPPFRTLTKEEVLDIQNDINSSGANIVWCGLGCPKQEKWMFEFRSKLNAQVLIGVGAGFDFLSGEKPLATEFIKNSGFEWLFRLIKDPKYLWKRYFKIVPLFLILIVLEFLGLYKNNNK